MQLNNLCKHPKEMIKKMRRLAITMIQKKTTTMKKKTSTTMKKKTKKMRMTLTRYNQVVIPMIQTKMKKANEPSRNQQVRLSDSIEVQLIELAC